MGFSVGSWKENSGVTLPETNMAPYKEAFPKRNIIFQAPIFRCYVGFREGDLYTSQNEYCIEPKNWTPGWGGEFSRPPFSGSTLVFLGAATIGMVAITLLFIFTIINGIVYVYVMLWRPRCCLIPIVWFYNPFLLFSLLKPRIRYQVVGTRSEFLLTICLANI